ncbi:MAG: hypothetical protein K2Q06_10895 [Parvularculaceae bacterium]|nr:hypothetical protein [Parvularculaceae bacterium]
MTIKALFIATAAFAAASSADAGRFVEAGGAPGTSVSITDDGCTASVLFDDARVRGPGDLRERQRLQLPLRIIGASDVAVEARGFASGSAEAAAILATRAGEETLFDSDFGDDPNWSREVEFEGLRGRLWLVLALDAGDDAAEQTELGVDSIDLSIADCGADER